MTIAELKAANSIHLYNHFTYRFITRTTADLVRELLVSTRPDIYRW
jgi:hypothetical protein